MVAEYSTIVASPTEAKISYLTNDHLGSPRILTDQNGQVISRRDFLPYGEEIPRANQGTLESPNQPTFYNYNIKGELTKITQGNPNQSGQPLQNRYFMYDGLGRLIRVRQPEQTPNASLNTTGNPDNNQWTARVVHL